MCKGQGPHRWHAALSVHTHFVFERAQLEHARNLGSVISTQTLLYLILFRHVADLEIASDKGWLVPE